LSKIGNLLPPASVNSRIGLPFLVLDTVDSTNNYAMGQLHAGLAKHGQAYFALHQFAGKGQRGNTWNASPGENITVSIILVPDFSNNRYSFLLSAAVAMSCIDLLKDYSVAKTCIKWPNDIYISDRKTGGILIENVYRANEWKYAVVGIGLNINQKAFPNFQKEAISLSQVTGQHYDPIIMAKELFVKLQYRYDQLFTEQPEVIMEEYNSLLYKKDQVTRIRKENMVFETTIKKISLSGQLHTADVIERCFEFGEVEWLG
jgi:BirA family biotin operon repressor/biotin-[acetyl-CoA-carboxylase] ligase